MKTQSELKAHYRDVIMPMVAKYNFDHGTDVKPWECVKTTHGSSFFIKHPDFTSSPESYTFAITILEGKPVFVGDKLYYKKHAKTHYTVMESGLSPSTVIGIIPFDDRSWDDMSWTPSKKRTFMLNGVELPCPIDDYRGIKLDFLCIDYYFDTIEDRNRVASTINNLLTEARDKE